MNETKKEVYKYVLEQAKREMKNLVKWREEAQSIPLPELAEMSYVTEGVGFGFSLHFPFRVDLIQEHKDAMNEAGWESIGDTGNPVTDLANAGEYNFISRYYVNSSFNRGVTLWYSVATEGANCKRVKIGTETIEQNIYEVVCNEGIEEGAL